MKAAKFLILAFVTIWILPRCFGDGNDWATNELGGIENAAVIAKPLSAKAWRTVGSLELNSESFKIEDLYRKSGQGKPVSAKLAAQLSKLLLDTNTYPHFDGSFAAPGKNCAPMPAVVVTFSDGKKNVDIFFCFECAILIIKTDGKPTPGGLQTDFDPGRAKLLQVVKKIFPKDQQIQSL